MSSLYIHIPFCKQKCHYCNFYSTVSSKNRDLLIDSIIEEINNRSNYLFSPKLDTIYFGGGTPSLLTHTELSRIFNAINSNFEFDKSCEITFEANPDDLNDIKFDEFIDLGINRLSIGIQSFNNNILKKLNRIHNSDQAIQSVELAKKKGISNISIDLIYGIPGLTLANWQKDLDIFRDLNIPHLSSYFLTVEEKTALDILIRKGKYPKLIEEEGLAHFDYLVDFIHRNKYEQYEISNFCKDGLISKHNSNYWNNITYLGIGPSAHSYNLNSRQWNKSSITNYISDIKNLDFNSEIEFLSEKDKFNEFVMLGLRTRNGIDLLRVRNFFGAKYYNYLLKYIDSNFDKDFFTIQNNVLILNINGKKYADGIASDLFIV